MLSLTLAIVTERQHDVVGLDGPGWETTTTAHDLGMIYRTALNYPLFGQIIHQQIASIPQRRRRIQDDRQPRSALLLNGYPGFIGEHGLHQFLPRRPTSRWRSADGKRLIAVMMYGSDDLWDQGRALLDWGQPKLVRKLDSLRSGRTPAPGACRKPSIAGGAAVNRAPLQGSSSSLVRCSTT